MKVANLSELLTEEEIKECFNKSDRHLVFYELSTLSVENLNKACMRLLPLIYPSGITKNKAIISVGWEFITKRAIKKNIKLFN